jgi:glutamate mutase epsilon subunit
VELDENSRQYTAFICPRGLFEYNVLTMELTNETETFQRLMNTLFEDILHKIVEVYLDEIIIFSQTLPEHVQHVKRVVERLIKNVLKMKLSKCKLVEQKIEYLSHIIHYGSIKPNPQK